MKIALIFNNYKYISYLRNCTYIPRVNLIFFIVKICYSFISLLWSAVFFKTYLIELIN